MTSAWTPSFTTRPEIEGAFGVVASTHWIASAVGMAVLEQGGNAFDAGVATAFTLQVVEPHLNGPAGDVPILVHDAASRATKVICGQGPAPMAATIDHFRSLELDLVPGTGLLPACVPGAFDAWMLLLRDHGTFALRDVLKYAIDYARRGIPVVPQIHHTISSVEQVFLDHWKTSAAVFLHGGAAPAVGSLLVNPGLADTYERIVREAEAQGGAREDVIERARAIWSGGFVAEAIVGFCEREEVHDVSGRAHRGLLRESDLTPWRAHVEEPVFVDYRDCRVFKAGFWSQGPLALQQLAILRHCDLDGLDPTGPDFIHLQVEAAKLAFADREAFYGDPDFIDVPRDILLGDDYNRARRRLIGETASKELRPGAVDGFGGAIVNRAKPGNAALSSGAGEPTLRNVDAVQGDTVHFDIIDRFGNMVAATPSGGWLQSSPVIPELGFPLGTRAQMFWLTENLPNSLAPGKRPRTTLTPTMAFRDGAPYLAWGTPGGDQQDQWIVQFLLRHLHAGMNLQQAIDAPAWHTEHFPSSFWPRTARPGVLVVEDRLPASTIEELRRRGHEVEVNGSWSEGRLTAASQLAGRLRAAANPRGMQGYAIGR